MKCPPFDDGPDRDNPTYLAHLAAAYRQAQSDCVVAVPSTAHVRKWHLLAFRARVPVAYYAGHFRQRDASRICLEIEVQVDGVRGTTFALVPLASFEHFRNTAVELTSLEVLWPVLTPPQRTLRFATAVAAAVGGFIRIHPFLNGNGRMSRLLWTSLLLRQGFRPQCSVPRRPAAPYDDVMKASMGGDDRPLALLVLQGLAQNAAP